MRDTLRTLAALAEAGVTSCVAVAIATGINELRMASILSGFATPSSHESLQLTRLHAHYVRAIRVANAEGMKARILANGAEPSS